MPRTSAVRAALSSTGHALQHVSAATPATLVRFATSAPRTPFATLTAFVNVTKTGPVRAAPPTREIATVPVRLMQDVSAHTHITAMNVGNMPTATTMAAVCAMTTGEASTVIYIKVAATAHVDPALDQKHGNAFPAMDMVSLMTVIQVLAIASAIPTTKAVTATPILAYVTTCVTYASDQLPSTASAAETTPTVRKPQENAHSTTVKTVSHIAHSALRTDSSRPLPAFTARTDTGSTTLSQHHATHATNAVRHVRAQATTTAQLATLVNTLWTTSVLSATSPVLTAMAEHSMTVPAVDQTQP